VGDNAGWPRQAFEPGPRLQVDVGERNGFHDHRFGGVFERHPRHFLAGGCRDTVKATIESHPGVVTQDGRHLRKSAGAKTHLAQRLQRPGGRFKELQRRHARVDHQHSIARDQYVITRLSCDIVNIALYQHVERSRHGRSNACGASDRLVQFSGDGIGRQY
jgi:hypothetical protein